MFSQSYSISNLTRFILPKDMISLGKARDKHKLLLKDVCHQIATEKFKYGPFNVLTIKKKRHFFPKRTEDNWILRKLNFNITRLYKVKQANRFTIVKQIATLLQEELPMTIMRYDVKNFYESIDKDVLVNKLITDSLLSYHSKRLLTELLYETKIGQYNGLPRGICISSTLSEIWMRDFDNHVRRLAGVYFYARYVDDIVIFAFDHHKNIQTELPKNLPKGLKFNKEKSNIVCEVKSCHCKPTCQCSSRVCKCHTRCQCEPGIDPHNLQYLGYRFSFSDYSGKRKVLISLADKKIKKIKSRIVHALLAFEKDKNFPLLKNRIMFLTGNHYIVTRADGPGLKSGIYYNYPILTDMDCLKQLNEFLSKMVFAHRTSFGKRFCRTLSIDQKKELVSNSFECGHQKKVMHNFSPTMLAKIKRCWNYEHN